MPCRSQGIHVKLDENGSYGISSLIELSLQPPLACTHLLLRPLQRLHHHFRRPYHLVHPSPDPSPRHHLRIWPCASFLKPASCSVPVWSSSLVYWQQYLAAWCRLR